jgi:DNA-binding NarL/FixJ family response regulator
MITRIPSFLFGALGTAVETAEWNSDGAETHADAGRRRAVALVDDDAAFLKKLGRRGRPAMMRFKVATPLLLKARHAASLDGTAPWSAVVISVGLADMNGITAMARLKTLFPKLPVWLALPMEEPHSMIAAICAGADGYLLKHADGTQLRECLAALPDGEPPMSGRLATHLYGLLMQPCSASAPAPAHYGFTAQQVGFIRMTAERGSTVEAARILGIEAGQRSELLRSIYRQLRNRITSAAILGNMRLNHLAIH